MSCEPLLAAVRYLRWDCPWCNDGPKRQFCFPSAAYRTSARSTRRHGFGAVAVGSRLGQRLPAHCCPNCNDAVPAWLRYREAVCETVMKKEVVWPKQSLEPTQLQSWATSSVRLGRSDGEHGGQEPSLWEEARKRGAED
jgi:hypothetical protein